MEYRRLGRSGLKISPICLGAMMFGGPADEKTSLRIIAAAGDAGINFIDTADVYNGGESEVVVGRAIRGQRQRWVVATKVNGVGGPGPNERGSSRKWIFEAVKRSLARLGTDYIDVYYLHREDLQTPLDETVRAMGDLIRMGAIRYFALSNHKSWRLAEICNMCDRLGLDRPVASQPYYNAMNRQLEVEHLPACAFYGLGVVPYSPLARGVLSGKYDPDAPPPNDSRAARQDTRMMQTEWRRESLVIAHTLKAHAEARGIKLGQFAFAWVLNNRLVTSVIAGPRTEEQLSDYIGALDYRFTVEDEALVSSLVSPGHPSTPGYTDPVEPVEGRPTLA
ncbi:MAG: aldo/keto reductase [Proteobacteria bacterium]|nr:aldo/keto reductase [Pseudomonadota bacterium]